MSPHHDNLSKISHLRSERSGRGRLRSTRLRAFTLIEVMMALALLVGVAAATWQSMSLSFETKRVVSDINDRYHEGRQVMSRLARELRMAFLLKPLPEQMREHDPTSTTRFLGGEDELYFATTAHLRLHAGDRESDQAEVHYKLERGARDNGYRGLTLYRRESSRVDDEPDKGGSTWAVVEGVKELKFEYWDDRKEVGDDAWTADWDSEDNQILPERIRITLVLERKEGEAIRFVTQAAPRIRVPISPLENL